MPFAPQQSTRPLQPSELQALRVNRVMPAVILAAIMSFMTIITVVIVLIAWNRVPASKWVAGAIVLIDSAVMAGVVMHARSSSADITDGIAHIKTGKVTNKRTSGRSTTYHVTLDGIGEVTLPREQFEAMEVGRSYTVSFSPRIKRAWTVDQA